MASQKHLVMLDQGFTFKGRRFNEADVQSLFYKAVKTRHSVNGIPTGTSYRADLVISLKSGEKLRIRYPAFMSFSFMGNSDKAKTGLFELYREIANRTFEQRAKRYLESSKPNAFTYKNVELVAPKMLVHKGKQFDLNVYTLRRNGGHMSIWKKEPTFLEKVKNRIISPPSFHADDDTDVFYAMLNKIVGLSWA